MNKVTFHRTTTNPAAVALCDEVSGKSMLVGAFVLYIMARIHAIRLIQPPKACHKAAQKSRHAIARCRIYSI